MPSAYSIQCPACGQAFLSTYSRPDSVTICPHCAHSAPLQNFLAGGVTTIGPAPVTPLRRREFRRTPEITSPSGTQSDVSQSQNLAPPSIVVPLVEPQHQTPPGFPTYHAEPTAAVPPSLPPFLPMGKALPAQPLLDHQHDAHHWQPPRSGRSNIWWLGLLTLGLLGFTGGVIWRHYSTSAPVRPPLEDLQPAQGPQMVSLLPTDNNQESTTTALPPAKRDLTVEIEHAHVISEAPGLIARLFATEQDDRSRLIIPAEGALESMAAFFSKHGRLEPILEPLPANAILLATGQPVLMFRIGTRVNPGGALARFERTQDGQLRLDWMLFEETHELKLEMALRDAASNPSWFTVGLKKNHGLDFDEAFRASHHCFDLQGSPRQSAVVKAAAPRELPVGRLLHDKTDWRTVYLARFLMQPRRSPDGTPYMEILDTDAATLRRR